jgi:hypothetical protein
VLWITAVVALMRSDTTSPAIVAPIRGCKYRNRFGSGQVPPRCPPGNPCTACAISANPHRKQLQLTEEPADLWDLIWFFGVIALATLCTIAVVCGVAGWVYATSFNLPQTDIKAMPEPIESIASIEALAKAAALVYSDIKDACPYPFGSDAAHHFKAAFSYEREVIEAKKARNEGASS